MQVGHKSSPAGWSSGTTTSPWGVMVILKAGTFGSERFGEDGSKAGRGKSQHAFRRKLALFLEASARGAPGVVEGARAGEAYSPVV